MRFTHRPGFTRFAQAQPHVTHLNCLKEGTDGHTDTLSAQAGRLALPRQRRRCGGKKAEARTAGHPGQQQGEPLAPLNAVWGPVAGTHVLLFFCLISLQPGVCQKGFAVDTGERGLGRREPGRRRRPFSLLCRGGHVSKCCGVGTGGGRDRGSALRPPLHHPAGAQGHVGTRMGTTVATHVWPVPGVPLVPRSAGCFFQGRPSSFRGGFSGSRRWSCCRRSSRLRAASSTGAGSAGNRAGGQGWGAATIVPIPPLWPRGRGCHPLCPCIPRAAAIRSLLTNRDGALACHPRCHPMCHPVLPITTPKPPRDQAPLGVASGLLIPKHGGTRGTGGPGPPSLGSDNGSLCRGKQVLSEPYVFPLSALHHH